MRVSIRSGRRYRNVYNLPFASFCNTSYPCTKWASFASTKKPYARCQLSEVDNEFDVYLRLVVCVNSMSMSDRRK